MQSMQQSINDQARAQAQAQQAAAQQQMMNQNAMQGQVPRTQPAQQGFHHLQHQMTASPIPGQVNQQPNNGMPNPNAGMPQNMNPQQQQFQLSMQQQGQQQAPNGIGRPQNGQPNMQSQQEALVNQLGHRLMQQASEEEKNQMRNNIQARMEPTVLQGYAAKGIDPLFLYYRQQALQKLGAQRRQQQQQQQQAQAQAQAQSLITQQQTQNIPATAPPMQPQRSTNGQAQPPTSTGGNADFFVGNMMDQQQQGVMAEQAGQTVVPMSNAQRNATPQPGLMAGQQMNMNEQRTAGNPNMTAQQRQQLFNAQQQRAQQQQVAQAQAQAQAQQQQNVRANAQVKAQQMALQGQIGGMGPGPMPPQQSPAMATLNAPLTRTPNQMSQPEPAQVNPNAQFGQPLDPRFAQGNQRAQMNAAIISTMPPHMQNQISTFPPEKVNEVVARWHLQRQQQQNGQAGRQQLPMQGNNQMRPGQNMPPGQFNPQNPLAQFMMANPGRAPPPQLTNGLNPQQQLMLQQQLRNMNPNHLQQRNANAIPMNPQAAQHMDQMDIPQQALAHPTMPRNVPSEIKKWGALKNWVQQSGGLAPDTLGNVMNLQKVHYNQQLRARNAAAQAQAGIQNQGQGAPGILPPGIAPTANMGMPQPGIPPVTNIDIQNARMNAPQLANVTDEQIRSYLMRNRQNNHQQQQQRQNQIMMQQQQMQMAQMAQLNNQQPRPGMPGQFQQPGAPNITGQMQQPKQPQPVAEPTPAPASRANRAPPVNRGNPPQSSPAEPPKNLKRQSSEDVVEVPNPNAQQPQRSTPQQNAGMKGAARPARPQQLTHEQIQKLDPEARKRYEHSVRMFQQHSQQNANASNPLLVKLREIAMEESARGQSTPMPDLPMDAATKATIQTALSNVIKPLRGMTQAMSKWYEATHDDVRARNFFRMQYRIRKQFKDEAQYTEMKDTFSIKPDEIDATRQVLGTMIADLSNMMPAKVKRPAEANRPQVDPATASVPTPPQASAAQQVPLNAANLQQQQNQLMNHPRAPSSNIPAAPTSSQPPFPFGGAGTPAYHPGNKAVTQADLKMPPQKKRKNGNGPSAELGTPGSTASPLANKTVSPESRRPNAAEAKQQAKPLLCCSEPDCDRHKHGFESEEALKKHRDEEHIKPLANPSKYAEENLAAALGLDSEGRAKTSTTGEKMVQSDSRQGQTPSVKVGTPMSRTDSMIRQGSTAGKPTPKAQPDSLKAAAPSQVAALADPWANATIDPQELFATFQGFEAIAGGIGDMSVYRSITPNESPESNSTAVTETSDISDGVGLDINLDLSFDESWMPFGGGDITGLADLSNFDFGNEELTMQVEDDQPMANYMSWDDTQQDFNKPFEFDTSMYLMNPGQ